MSTLIHPALLIELGAAGETGLAFSADPRFQREMDQCREWGFELQTADGRISLPFDHDKLVPYWIQKETRSIAWESLSTHGFLRVASTNSEAIRLASLGAPEGTLVYAEEQTAGRGRKNRNWHSPPGAGLYFTLILRPTVAPEFWPLLTHVSSVSLVETLKELNSSGYIPHPLQVDIKWPNDVLLSGKKCAGILLESVLSDRTNPAAVVGVGIDIRKGSVPENLASEAVCLEEAADAMVPRRKVLVQFLHHFQLTYLMFEQGKNEELLRRWKSLSSMYNGARVWIGKDEERREATTCGINEIGALLVRTADGAMQTIFADDISISGFPKK